MGNKATDAQLVHQVSIVFVLCQLNRRQKAPRSSGRVKPGSGIPFPSPLSGFFPLLHTGNSQAASGLGGGEPAEETPAVAQELKCDTARRRRRYLELEER